MNRSRSRWPASRKTENKKEVGLITGETFSYPVLEPKDPTSDTFTEKLISQIIKNLQIRIKNIHVRYEDKYTDPKRPFACGATLESLDFEVGCNKILKMLTSF